MSTEEQYAARQQIRRIRRDVERARRRERVALEALYDAIAEGADAGLTYAELVEASGLRRSWVAQVLRERRAS